MAINEDEEKRAIDRLLSFIEDLNSPTRLAILEAISQIRSQKTNNILENIALLLVDRDIMIRRIASRFFEEIETPSPNNIISTEGNIIAQLPEATQYLILNRLYEQFKTGSDDYKEFGAFWLGMMSFRPAYETLLQHLHDPAENVVIAVINGLGLFGDVTAIPHLIPFITHNNVLIQKKAIESIGNLGEQSEGLQNLIHQLYLDPSYPHPTFLETHILSFGGRVLDLLAYEIEYESNPARKASLMQFYDRVTTHYKIATKDNYEILL